MFIRLVLRFCVYAETDRLGARISRKLRRDIPTYFINVE